MCHGSLQSISKTISDKSLFHGISQSNTLRRIIAPGSERVTDVGQGKGSFESVVDPSNFTQQSIPQKLASDKAKADALAAPDRAANSATDLANQALLNRKRRRQSGLGSLSTGAVGGTGQLAPVSATGMSTLGA